MVLQLLVQDELRLITVCEVSAKRLKAGPKPRIIRYSSRAGRFFCVGTITALLAGGLALGRRERRQHTPGIANSRHPHHDEAGRTAHLNVEKSAGIAMVTSLKIFIVVLLVVLLAHAFVDWLRPDVTPRFSFLPGDIKYEGPGGNIRVYFPIVTSIVLSVALTLILRLFGRFFGR
jgi:hypothetical protein